MWHPGLPWASEEPAQTPGSGDTIPGLTPLLAVWSEGRSLPPPSLTLFICKMGIIIIVTHRGGAGIKEIGHIRNFYIFTLIQSCMSNISQLLKKAKSLTGTRFVFMISIIFYYCQFSQNLLDFLKYKIKPPSFVCTQHLPLPCYFDKTTSFGLNYKYYVTFLLKIHQGSLSISSLHGVKGPFKCQFKFTCLSLSFKQSLFQPCQQTYCFPNELYNFNFLALANAATPAC